MNTRMKQKRTLQMDIGDGSGKGNAMTEAEAMAELTRLDEAFGQMAEDERQHFENLLYLRAMIHGWTGDPLCQPATSVLGAYRQMRAERDASDSDRLTAKSTCDSIMIQAVIRSAT
jgi:hypothetical protein